MYIFATFEHNTAVEMTLELLQEAGIAKEHILAVPLEKRKRENRIFDTIHHSDGISLFDTAAVLGTLFAVLGATYGFIWPWGPVFCGLIGMLVGTVSGFFLDLSLNKGKNRTKRHQSNVTEVVLMISCHSEKAESLTKLLWQNGALGVAALTSSP